MSVLQDIYTLFPVFMADMVERLTPLGLTIDQYPLDHVCFRVFTLPEFEAYRDHLTSLSVLYTTKFFHDRYFHTFVLKNPLTYNSIATPYLEFSQPGGSDAYSTGFQHLEWHTNTPLQSLSSRPGELQKLIFTGKYDNETYLKWPDKICLKVTPTPVITKSLLENDSKINLVG